MLIVLEDVAGPRSERDLRRGLFLELDDGSVCIVIQLRRESMEAARDVLPRLAAGRAEIESRERLRLTLRPPRPPRNILSVLRKRE